MKYQIGDIIYMKLTPKMTGVITNFYEQAPSSIEVLWFHNNCRINYTYYCDFDYFEKVS